MKCLRCGAELHKKTCSACGYTLKEGERIVSLFELDIDKINAELKKVDADVYFKRGHEHYQKKEYEQAIAGFTKAIELDPDCAIAYYSREVAVLMMDKKEASKSCGKEPQSAPSISQGPEGFVFIEGGTFMMGSPLSEPNRGNDETQHSVTVSSFYMGKYAVTQQEYQEVMGSNPSHFKGDNLPVECVSWFDAVEYCNRRSQREGLSPVYTVSGDNVTWNRSAKGYRLPTEAEWEYACRAGTTTPYSSGNSVDNAGWYRDNSGGKTHPVGKKQANPWGLYDMHGNVWEWCWDWYGDYSTDAQTDPLGASSGSFRVGRGGSWFFYGQVLRSANRSSHYPSLRHYYLGFRLLRP